MPPCHCQYIPKLLQKEAVIYMTEYKLTKHPGFTLTKPICICIFPNDAPDDGFSIILPEKFLTLPTSINATKKWGTCSTADIIIENWFAHVYKHPGHDEHMIDNGAYITNKHRICLIHETDGSFTVTLPKRLHNANHCEISKWVNDNFNHIAGWI